MGSNSRFTEHDAKHPFVGTNNMKPKGNSQIHSFKPELTPLAKATRNYRQLIQLSLLAASSTLAISPVLAQQEASEELMLEEITVTATKRVANLQDVPISVTALNTRAIEELGIQSFTDYVQQMPTVTFKSFGAPGGADLHAWRG